ncbi:MAG: acyl-CoA dehydrogenase family protein [Salinigranum sp.]
MKLVPAFELNEEQRALRREIRSFVAEEVDLLDVNDWEWRDDPRDRIPWEAVEAATERGLKDLTVPEEFGGMDASALTLTMAAEEMAAGEMGIAVIFDQNWKIARIIDNLARDNVREEFFEAYTDDPRHLLAVCLTEPDNGSNHITHIDEMQFSTTAERDGDEWVLDGVKRFQSNAADAKTYVVFAQTDPTVPAQEGTTAFLVPREADGLEVTHVWEKISQRMVNNATIEFDGVRVPDRYVLGEVDMAKSNQGDAAGSKESNIEAGAIALGTARRAFEDAFAYAHEREQGGAPIVDHQVIGHDFARMAMELGAARALLWTAARAVDRQGEDYQYEYGAMGKVYAAEVAFDVSKRALEKFGGAGIMLETEYPVQKYLRDTLSYLHSDGTQEAHTQRVVDALRARYAEVGDG